MKEDLIAIGFMLIGLGFFCFIINLVRVDNREGYERRVMEAREFGFDSKSRHTIHTLKGK